MSKRTDPIPCLNLAAVHPSLRPQTLKAFAQGDADTVVFSGEAGLCLVADNAPQLKGRGLYEKCLLLAFASVRTNLREWSSQVLKAMFTFADKKKLRAASDTIPDLPVYHVFRGVAGHGVARRVSGVSWTLSLDAACWFATRFHLAHPAVLAAEIRQEEILAYWTRRSEDEVFCYPDSFRRVKMTVEQIEGRAARHWQLLQEMSAKRRADLFAKLHR